MVTMLKRFSGWTAAALLLVLSSPIQYAHAAPACGPGTDFVCPTVTPEPSTYLLMLVGLGGVAYVARRRNRKEK